MHNPASLTIDTSYLPGWEIRNKMEETEIKAETNLERGLKD